MIRGIDVLTSQELARRQQLIDAGQVDAVRLIDRLACEVAMLANRREAARDLIDEIPFSTDVFPDFRGIVRWDNLA